MKPEGNVEIYRVAFDAANSELAEISAEFERLRSRKDHIERLVQVLHPLIADGENAIEGGSVSGPMVSGEMSGEKGAVAETVTADPFQRRIDHVLGIGGGIRDVRKYSRQF